MEPSLITTRSKARGVMSNITDVIDKVTEFIPGVKTRSRLKIDHSKGSQHAFVAFTAIQQVAMLATAQPGTFTPAFEDPEPKSQRAARKRTDWKDWVQAEQAEYEKVTDMGEILGYGIMMTPGLVVDGEIKSSGKLPSMDEIKGYLSR